MEQDLKRRLDVLESIEAIKKLKALYCTYCDEYNADAIASQFVADGVWDAGTLGHCEGVEGIRDFFRKAPEIISFAVHQLTNPVIEVDGDRATGRWVMLEPCTLTDGNRGIWMIGRYEDEYVRVGGEWKYKSLKFIPTIATPFEDGWVKRRFIWEE